MFRRGPEDEREALGPPSLSAAIRSSVSGLVESLHAYLAVNLVLLVIVAVTILLIAASPLALALVPLLAPPACALVRLAVVGARGDNVALRTAYPGLTHRFWMKAGVAAVQCLVLFLAVLNLFVAPAIGGVLGAASLAFSVYLIGSVLTYATVLWPLICDPAREQVPLGPILRLAMIIVLRHPIAVIVLVVILVLSVLVIRNLIVPAIFLPSMYALMMSAYVIPAADEIAPLS